jgi:hypothetical protein
MKTGRTTAQIARHYGLETWQVRRLYERKILPPAERFGLLRVIFDEDLPAVEAGLRKLGYLKAEAAVAV